MLGLIACTIIGFAIGFVVRGIMVAVVEIIEDKKEEL